MPTILVSEDRTQTEERIRATLIEEALKALERFIETGSRDQAQKAFDCLRAWGLSPRSLGEVDSWDIRFAEQMYFFLLKRRGKTDGNGKTNSGLRFDWR